MRGGGEIVRGGGKIEFVRLMEQLGVLVFVTKVEPNFNIQRVC